MTISNDKNAQLFKKDHLAGDISKNLKMKWKDRQNAPIPSCRLFNLNKGNKTKMNYPELESIRSSAIRLRLIGYTLLVYMPIDVLAASYNGTGPEFLPQKIRDRLDAACRPFLPAVMVHDVDFTMSDGSRRSFRIANLHLLLNCITCANHAYAWMTWRRYALYLQAWAMYRAVSHPQFGWVAWIQAYNKNKRKDKPNE